MANRLVRELITFRSYLVDSSETMARLIPGQFILLNLIIFQHLIEIGRFLSPDFRGTAKLDANNKGTVETTFSPTTLTIFFFTIIVVVFGVMNKECSALFIYSVFELIKTTIAQLLLERKTQLYLDQKSLKIICSDFYECNFETGNINKVIVRDLIYCQEITFKFKATCVCTYLNWIHQPLDQITLYVGKNVALQLDDKENDPQNEQSSG